ncbi:MAG: hypothetical protein GX643_14480 [Acidimicrobiales bacterium]|nr:hypothetical protein [Acidimicrobiales bacterium]
MTPVDAGSAARATASPQVRVARRRPALFAAPPRPSSSATLAAIAAWWWGVARIDLSSMSDAGLVSVLGWQIFAAFALLGLGFALELNEPRRRYVLAAQTVVLVVMVQGITALAEPHPAYFTAYLHVGFINEIIENGHTVPELDARFNWPGSFAFGALIASSGGASSALSLLRWAPVVFNVAYLAPLWMIGRSLVADERARWIALWLFVAANWVHQDYLSPQAEAYFLYLVVIAVVLRHFDGRTRPWTISEARFVPSFVSRPVAWVQGLGRHDSSHLDLQTSTDDGPFLLRVVVLVVATVVVSHQLTPFAILLVVAALVMAGRSSAVHLPVVVVVLFAMWFSVGATTWWISHLGELLGDFGKVGDNASAGLLGRLGGTDLRAAVLWLRVAFSAAMLGGAMLVALRQARRGAPPIAALALFVPPFALIGGQSYGGEVLLRSYLFALPAAAVLVAQALSRVARSRNTRVGTVLLASMLAVVAVAGVTVRFGNERFEQVTTADLAAVDWVYDNVPHGSVVIAPTRNLPWRYRDLTSFRYEPVDEQPLETVDEVLALVPGDSPAFMIVTDAQQRFGEQLAFLPEGWLDSITEELIDSGRATPVFGQDGAVVLRLDPAPAGGS